MVNVHVSDDRSRRPPGVPQRRANDLSASLVDFLQEGARRGDMIYMVSHRRIGVAFYVAGVVAVAGFVTEERPLIGTSVCHDPKQRL